MRFLIIQHLSIEPPALIGETLCAAGHELHYIHVDEGDALPENTGDFAGVVIMGGPQSANDSHLAYIDNELRWLSKALADGMPMLGICLGAQMMAKAAAAEIIRSPIRELGWYPVFPTSASRNDPLFANLPSSGLQVFQWHGETFSLPDQATLIATHPDVPQQVFRLKQAQYGLQCHVEVDELLIERWIAAGNSERSELGEPGIAAIHAGGAQHLNAMRSFCRKMTKNWLTLID